MLVLSGWACSDALTLANPKQFNFGATSNSIAKPHLPYLPMSKERAPSNMRSISVTPLVSHAPMSGVNVGEMAQAQLVQSNGCGVQDKVNP